MFKTIKTTLIAATALALAGTTAQAGDYGYTAEEGASLAVTACWIATGYADVEVLQVAHDGLGDFLVWLADDTDAIALCNATPTGEIFAFSMIEGDMLGGMGQQLLAEAGYQRVGNAVRETPQQVANTICALPFADQVEVVASVEDGVGGYIVWMQDSAEGFWMCGATGAAEVYAFERVGEPLVAIDGLQEA